ncbi:MAG: hypothetical protein ACYC5O_14270 [Anaerolineae bacterium]
MAETGIDDRATMWLRILRQRRLYVLLAVALIATTIAYQRLSAFHLELGSAVHGSLLEGFHAPESSPSGPFRWTNGEAHLRLPAMWPGRDLVVTCVLSAPRPAADGQAAPPVAVQLLANGRPVATWDATGSPAEYVAHVPAAYVGPGGDLDLAIVSPTFAPAGDLRSLGAIVTRLDVAPVGALPARPSTRALLGVAALVGLSYAWSRCLGAGTDAATLLAGALVVPCSVGLLLARPFTPPLVERVLFLLVVGCLGSEVTARLAGVRVPRSRQALAALFVVAFAVRLVVAHTPGDHDNFIAFKMMIENVTQNGITAAYEIDPIIGAYPPLHHYFLAISGGLYRAFVSPEFDTGSARLDFLMKIPTIVMDVVILATIVIYAVRRAGERKGLLLGAVYALNPGIIYTVAYNGQLGDPLYSGLIAIAVAGLLSLQPGVTGVATALAVLTKPQAAAFLPFLALAALRHFPHHQLQRTILAGTIAAVLVLAPFVVAGTLPHMLRTVLTTVGHGPRIVSNALNVWWLWGWGDAWNIRDTELLFGLVPYRTVGLVLFFAVAYGLVVWRLWRSGSRRLLSLLAAFVGLCFFMLPTEIHENYLFPTLPLLALAAVHDRRALYAGGILSLTWFLNMVSYDQTIVPRLTTALPGLAPLLFPLQVALALANVAVLVAMTYWIVRAPSEGPKGLE